MLNAAMKLFFVICAAANLGVAVSYPAWVPDLNGTTFVPLRGVCVAVAVLFLGVVLIDRD